MLILVGPSASGKTEIAKTLVSNFNFKKIITTTTREKRTHEMDDVDYHFLALDTFEKLESQNAFVETSTYQNNKYGLQKKDVIPFGVVILDPKGANNLKRLIKDDCFVIYVQTSRKTREQRLIHRSDSLSSRLERLESDDQIFDLGHLEHVDFICNNDHLTILEAAFLCHEKYQTYLKK